jgi:hypothetical protein
MLIYEHLDGKQDHELLILERRGLLNLTELGAWLLGQEAPPAETPVVIDGNVRELMTPAGPGGGRLTR